jgi:glyoxylase-like metal-dependent hydrolase (beta-lactamase superfamily II)
MNECITTCLSENEQIALWRLESGPVATNAYLLCCKQSHKAVIFDAPIGCGTEVLRLLAEYNLQLAAIHLTHSHWDHTADCAFLQRETGAKLFVHKADAYRLDNPAAHTVWRLPFNIEPALPDEFYPDSNTEISLYVGGPQVRLIQTPGHTEGGVCFFFPEEEWLIAGDTLFEGSVGRTDLPGGNMKQLISSILTGLLSLPPETLVLPGHGNTTTIGSEKVQNPFLLESL